MNVFSMLGAAGGMDGLMKQVEDFKSQFERLVSSMEQMQRDLDQIKTHLGIVPPELTEFQKSQIEHDRLLQNSVNPYNRGE